MTGGVVFNYRGSWCAEGCHTGWNGDWRIIGDRGTLIYTGDDQIKGQVVAKTGGFYSDLKDAAISESHLQNEGMHGALWEMLEFLRDPKDSSDRVSR